MPARANIMKVTHSVDQCTLKPCTPLKLTQFEATHTDYETKSSAKLKPYHYKTTHLANFEIVHELDYFAVKVLDRKYSR